LTTTLAPFAWREKPQVSSGIAVSFINRVHRCGKSAWSERVAALNKTTTRRPLAAQLCLFLLTFRNDLPRRNIGIPRQKASHYHDEMMLLTLTASATW
jgi:hypothetical protein